MKQNVGQHLSVPEATQELRSERIIVIQDHEHTDVTLCLPAQFVTDQILDLIEQVTQKRVTVVLSGERQEALQIVPIPTTDSTALTSSIDVYIKENRSTIGKAAMIRALVNPATRPSAVTQPGRIAIQRPHPGGVLRHYHHIEAVSDLLRIAGLEPGAITGRFTLPLEEEVYARQLATYWGGGILSLEDIVKFRKEHRVSFITETQLPTVETVFRLRHYQEIETAQPYLALMQGDLQELQATKEEPAPLVRLHSACATGDIFGSQRCDCQAQLHAALHQIAHEGRGILLYLPQEGRGIGLAGKLQAYALQEQGYDTLDANEHLGYPIDARDYSIAIEILQQLGITSARLLTNNPTKINALRDAAIAVETVPLEARPTSYNLYYLQTKHQRMHHTLKFLDNG